MLFDIGMRCIDCVFDIIDEISFQWEMLWYYVKDFWKHTCEQSDNCCGR